MSGEQGISTADEGCFEAAAAWLMKLRHAPNGQLSSEELQRWDQWIANLKNREALDAVQWVSQVLPLVSPPLSPTAEELAADRFDGSVPIKHWLASAEERELPPRAARRLMRWSSVGAPAIALV